ncbi:MAG: 16S rRNA (guanine(527)-N(7))-methyltransferase RsmG [Acidobacteria bacterium]|nr:16S rRNA (guanine(527)-N(7))-methyltransferase RsmG [Acidobacteriota bacterium]
MLTNADEFTRALVTYAPRYGVELSAQALVQLRRYYEHMSDWNALLHLVAPCSPTEFATRHILESLLALPFFRTGARVADVGSGAGLPIIPCLVLRPDIRATLVEANARKTVFLREALRLLDEDGAARVIAGRFETMPALEVDFVTCRALDRFTEMFSTLLQWSPRASQLLLFGGPALEIEIKRHALDYTAKHIPASEQRFLFVIGRAPSDS